MERARKRNLHGNPVTALLEDVLGCKWSWRILREVRNGVNRPGQLERAIEGISAKVLNERLRKLYRYTPLGERFFAILGEIEAVEAEYARGGRTAAR
jgi:DNA-binding HxlR family transcriptional regulator